LLSEEQKNVRQVQRNYDDERKTVTELEIIVRESVEVVKKEMGSSGSTTATATANK
jgi:hypothetical protein